MRVRLYSEEHESDDPMRSLLAHVKTASGGRLLNMHRQMASAPCVLAGYMGLRDVLAAHGTADGRIRSAVAVAASGADRGQYTLAINNMLATREGWSEEQIVAMSSGRTSGDSTVDALLEVAREAIAGDGSVSDTTWSAALDAGWAPEFLGELFAYVALVSYCDQFVRYARTVFDVEPSAATR